MIEVWKDIKGYEGLYQVSNLGNIKTLDRYFTNRWGSETFKPSRIIPQRLDKKGYSRMSVGFKGKLYTWQVHRLVATAFINNPNNKPCVNHIDFNTSNNKLENLEWVTYSENILHSQKSGRRNNCNKMSSDRFKHLHKNKDKRFKNYV